MSHATAAKPLEIMAMDFTQQEKSTSGIKNVLVFTDVFTKYTITIPTRDQTAKTVNRLFVPEWIKKLGVPERIHSNQSRSFENQIIKQLCLLYQVKKSKMTPYHHRGNSQVERFNHSMKEEKMDWPLTGIGICLQLYTPFHYILYSILSICLGMMPGYQWIIYFITYLVLHYIRWHTAIDINRISQCHTSTVAKHRINDITHVWYRWYDVLPLRPCAHAPSSSNK